MNSLLLFFFSFFFPLQSPFMLTSYSPPCLSSPTRPHDMVNASAIFNMSNFRGRLGGYCDHRYTLYLDLLSTNFSSHLLLSPFRFSTFASYQSFFYQFFPLSLADISYFFNTATPPSLPSSIPPWTVQIPSFSFPFIVTDDVRYDSVPCGGLRSGVWGFFFCLLVYWQ